VPIVAHLLHNSSVVDYAHVRVNVAATAIFPRLDGGAYCCATFTIMSVWIAGGVGKFNPFLPNCFLNPSPNTLSNCVLVGSDVYYIHTIYVTILVGLQQSKNSTPFS